MGAPDVFLVVAFRVERSDDPKRPAPFPQKSNDRPHRIACSRVSDSGEDAKEKGTRKVSGAGKSRKGKRAASALPSFLPFYFRVCAFSIQRTRLSRSLEQAIIEGRWDTQRLLGYASSQPRPQALFPGFQPNNKTHIDIQDLVTVFDAILRSRQTC